MNRATWVSAPRTAGAAIGFVLLIATAAACSVAPWSQPTRDDIIQRILPATVQVVVEQQEGRRLRTGSGVAVAARDAPRGTECFVLTSAHTVAEVEGRRQVHVVFDRHLGDGLGKKAPAVVLARREAGDVDLAILRAESDRCVAAHLASPPRLGTSVWVVGFPWGRHLTLSSGVISQLNFERAADSETAARLMVDASVSYGSSGGGVFDSLTGGLIGLVEGYRTVRLTSQGVAPEWYIDVPVPGQTVVTPLADIRRFLTDAGYAALLAQQESQHR
jgi:serine protease Do